MSAQYTGCSLDFYLLCFTEANLLGYPLSVQVFVRKPRKEKFESRIVKDFVFDLFLYGRTVLLLSEFKPK